MPTGRRHSTFWCLALGALLAAVACSHDEGPTTPSGATTAERLQRLADSVRTTEPLSPATLALLMASEVVASGAAVTPVEIGVDGRVERWSAVSSELSFAPAACTSGPPPVTLEDSLAMPTLCPPLVWLVAWQGTAPDVERVLAVTADTGAAGGALGYSFGDVFGGSSGGFVFAELLEPGSTQAWWSISGSAHSSELSRSGSCTARPRSRSDAVGYTCSLARFRHALDLELASQPFWSSGPAPTDTTKRRVTMSAQAVSGMHVEITSVPPLPSARATAAR